MYTCLVAAAKQAGLGLVVKQVNMFSRYSYAGWIWPGGKLRMHVYSLKLCRLDWSWW